MTKVKDAILRALGLDRAVNMIISLSVKDQFTVDEQFKEYIRVSWQASIYTATLAEFLAQHLKLPETLDVSSCFMAGLLHNLGVLVLDKQPLW